MYKLVTAAASLTILAACQTVQEGPAFQIGSASIEDRQGQQVGTARFFSVGPEVTVNVSFDRLTPGGHAVHLHTTGNCAASDFTSAGGHLNPGGNRHGDHLGDLPNVTIDQHGFGTVSAILPGTREEIEAALFDTDGTAVVVHEGLDDYQTDPAGAAGSRIACGVVRAS
jgi:superoxide dismutase, Cu-Zn family